MSQLTRIAIDIDDVVADFGGAIRRWANAKAGIDLQDHHYERAYEYWTFYESVWAEHGLKGQLRYDDFHDEMIVNQAHVAVMAGARDAIKTLKERYEVIFMTSRAPILLDASRKWLDENIDPTIPMYLANNPVVNSTAQSKGDLCVDLGVQLLIDDNIDNCQSARDNDVDAVLFGSYAWNAQAPESLRRCKNWAAVLEYVHGR